MGKRIYLAAPIHQQQDADNNKQLLEVLREWGYDVWSPQEAGIASEIAKQTGKPLDEVRAEFLKKDLSAMKTCDICLAYIGRAREPSQGMLWEMGWMYAANKLVIIYNPLNTKYTLMAQFTADWIAQDLDSLKSILEGC